MEKLHEGCILEARRYRDVISDDSVVECFIDGIDKEMETNAEQFKKFLANKLRYEVRTAFRTSRIPFQIKHPVFQEQSTEA